MFYNTTQYGWLLNQSQVYTMLVYFAGSGRVAIRQTNGNFYSDMYSKMETASAIVNETTSALMFSNDKFVAYDYYDNQQLTNFTVNISRYNGSNIELSTTTGYILSSVYSTSGDLWNVTYCSNQSGGYLCKDYTNQNMSFTPAGRLYQSFISLSAYEIVSNSQLTGTFSTTNATNSTGGGFYLKAGTYTFTFTKSGFYPYTKTITLLPATSTTENITGIFNATMNVTFKDNLTNAVINTATLKLYNSAYNYYIENSTTNGSILYPIAYSQNYTYNATASGYFDTTDGRIELTTNATNVTVYLYPIGGLTVEAINSDTGSRITNQTTTLLVQNSTTQLNFSLANGTGNLSGLALNEDYLFIFSSPGFDETNYYVHYDETQSESVFQGFLPISTSEFEFIVQTRNGQYLEGAYITVERFVNGSYVLAGSQLTNVVGSATFNVKTGITHRINISNSGYISQSFTDFLTTTPPYQIVLFETTTYTFDSSASGIEWSYYPTSSNLTPSNWTFDFNVTPDDNIELTNFGIILYDENNTIIGQNSSTVATGGRLTVYKNLAAYNTSWVLAVYSYKRDGFDTAYIFRKYYVATQPYSGSIFEARDYIRDTLSMEQRIWLWLLCLVACTVFIAVFIKGEGLLGIVTITAVGLGYVFSLNMYLVGALAAIIILYMLEQR